MIYADNAATTQLDRKAFEMMTPWLLDEYGNASQPYSFARKPQKALAESRAIIANCVGALPEEIYFTSGGTESDNWAIKGTAFSDIKDKQIITSAIEHHAILHACETIERNGCPVVYLTPTTQGYISPENLNSHISNNTHLVSVMYANNEIGTVQPIKELCSAAHAKGVIFHTDAVQAVGHVEIDVHDLGVDLLSASAHKFNGPKGVGFLYIKKGTRITPYMDGGKQESGCRAGTENIASIVGMAMALKANCDSLKSNLQYVTSLEHRLIAGINKAGISYTRNGETTLPGLISLSFPDADGEAILHRMDLMGISISTGSACDSVNTEISHVLRAINLDERLAKGTVRISLGKNNTENEVDRIVAALSKIIKT